MTNWTGFTIASLLLVVLPIWIIRLTKLGLGMKLLLTLAGIVAVYYAVEKGGASRGLFAKS